MEQDKVLSITCKDHSRLGRNYLVIGGLMDEFQKKNIRYIAIHDNIDTAKGIDDFLPLHDVFNEFHAKNTSKKIRAVVQAKGNSGKRLGVLPPYGYRKNESGALIIDEVSAKVVQRIFAMYVGGVNAGTIANTLSGEHLLIPSATSTSMALYPSRELAKTPTFGTLPPFRNFLMYRNILATRSISRPIPIPTRIANQGRMTRTNA